MKGRKHHYRFPGARIAQECRFESCIIPNRSTDRRGRQPNQTPKVHTMNTPLHNSEVGKFFSFETLSYTLHPLTSGKDRSIFKTIKNYPILPPTPTHIHYSLYVPLSLFHSHASKGKTKTPAAHSLRVLSKVLASDSYSIPACVPADA